MTSPRNPQSKLILLLAAFHLLIIAVSNYLVQIPVNVFGLQTTWGAFTFPMVFLATDLTVRLFGTSIARRIIFTAMLPALLISYLFSVLFFEGQFQGIQALGDINSFVGRIVIASFIAYICGQLLDIFIFKKLRQQKSWWVAPAVSSIIGGFIDTLLFFSIAFYRSTDDFMAANWPEIAAVDYGFKVLVSLLLFVPAYGVLMHTLAQRIKNTHPEIV